MNWKIIENDEMKLGDVPKSGADWDTIMDFSHTYPFEEIEEMDFEDMVEISNQVKKEYKNTGQFKNCSLNDLRLHLHLIERMAQHLGYTPELEIEYIKELQDLIEGIREKVIYRIK